MSGIKEYDLSNYEKDVNSWTKMFLMADTPGHCPICKSAEATYEGNKWRKEPKGYAFTCRKCQCTYVEKKRFLLPGLG